MPGAARKSAGSSAGRRPGRRTGLRLVGEAGEDGRTPGVGPDGVQPQPDDWAAWHLPGSQGWHTVVERVWRSRTDVESCRLCPLARCTARQRGVTVCTVVFSGYLTDTAIPLARWSGPGASPEPEPEPTAEV